MTTYVTTGFSPSMLENRKRFRVAIEELSFEEFKEELLSANSFVEVIGNENLAKILSWKLEVKLKVNLQIIAMEKWDVILCAIPLFQVTEVKLDYSWDEALKAEFRYFIVGTAGLHKKPKEWVCV
jgi:hypothetical protein